MTDENDDQNLDDSFHKKEKTRNPFFFFMRRKEKYLADLRMKRARRNSQLDNRRKSLSNNDLNGILGVNILSGKFPSKKKKEEDDKKNSKKEKKSIYFLGNSLGEETKNFYFSNNNNKIINGMINLEWKKIMINYNKYKNKKMLFNSPEYVENYRKTHCGNFKSRNNNLPLSQIELPSIYRPKKVLRCNSLKEFCSLKTKKELIDFYKKENENECLFSEDYEESEKTTSNKKESEEEESSNNTLSYQNMISEGEGENKKEESKNSSKKESKYESKNSSKNESQSKEE